MLVFITALTAAVSLTYQSPSETISGDWQLGRLQFKIDQFSEREISQFIPTVFTTRTDVHGVYLMCDQSSYRVRLPIKPMNMRDTVNGYQRRSIRRVNFKLFVDGEEAHSGKADLWTQMDAVVPVGRITAAKVFNAVVREQTVSFSYRNKDPIPLHLPPVDAVFRRFADECKAFQSNKELEETPLRDQEKLGTPVY